MDALELLSVHLGSTLGLYDALERSPGLSPTVSRRPATRSRGMMYGASVLPCLPPHLVETPSAATGTVMRADTLRRYAEAAGLAVEVAPIDNELFRFYVLRPA